MVKNRILDQPWVGPLRDEWIIKLNVDKWARYAKKLDSKSFFSNTKSPFAFLNNEFWTRGLRNWQDMGHKSFINNGSVNTLLKSYFWLNQAVNHGLNILTTVHNKKLDSNLFMYFQICTLCTQKNQSSLKRF